jgi:hypothetical protein
MPIATETWNVVKALASPATHSWGASQAVLHACHGFTAAAIVMHPCLLEPDSDALAAIAERPFSVLQTNNAVTARSVSFICEIDKPLSLAQLDRLRDISEGWNGYGAQVIDRITIEAAKQFINDLPDDAITTPLVVPMTRGRLQFEWHRGNRSLELEFENPRRINYLKVDDDTGVEEEDSLYLWQARELFELIHWFSAE